MRCPVSSKLLVGYQKISEMKILMALGAGKEVLNQRPTRINVISVICVLVSVNPAISTVTLYVTLIFKSFGFVTL